MVERILADGFRGVNPKERLYDKAKMIADTRNAPQYFVSNRLNKVKVRFYPTPSLHNGTNLGNNALPSEGALCGPPLGFGEMAAGKS